MSDSQNNTNTTVSRDELEYKANWIIKLYSSMVLGSFALELVVQFLMLNFTRKASLNLHNAMIEALVMASMAFYDNHFIGNILNRFSQDLTVVDEVLPSHINFFLMVSFISFRSGINVFSVFVSRMQFLMFLCLIQS